MNDLNAAIEKHLEEQNRTVASLADLDTFLRARLSEDEKLATQVVEYLLAGGGDEYGFAPDELPEPVQQYISYWTPQQMMAEVEAKRRLLDEVLPIVDELDEIAYGEGQGSVPYLEPRARFLKVLALPYADHADYRQEWRPE